MNTEQIGGTLLDVVKPKGYQTSRLSIKVNRSGPDDSNYNLDNVNEIDELQFLDKETSTVINPNRQYTGFIIFGVLDFNINVYSSDATSRDATYYDNFCTSTYRNHCEAFRCGTTVLRCTDTDMFYDTKCSDAYGETVYRRFNNFQSSDYQLNKAFNYNRVNAGGDKLPMLTSSTLGNRSASSPPHALILESFFYNDSGTRQANGIPVNPNDRNGYIDTFRTKLRELGFEILMTGLTRDEDTAQDRPSWKIKSGIIHAYYYRSFCFPGEYKNEKFDLVHRSAEDDYIFLNKVLSVINELETSRSIQYFNQKEAMDNIRTKILTLKQTPDAFDSDGNYKNNPHTHIDVWNTMKEIKSLRTSPSVKTALEYIYIQAFRHLRTSATHGHATLLLNKMLDNLMYTAGNKTPEIASMLEYYKYKSKSSGRQVSIGTTNVDGITNHSQQYLINRSKESHNYDQRKSLDPHKFLIQRKSFSDCVKRTDFQINYFGKMINYTFYMIKTHEYYISCPYNKIENPTDDHVYFIDFSNNSQRDIMFDGMNKCINFNLTWIDYDNYEQWMKDIVSIYTNSTISDTRLIIDIYDGLKLVINHDGNNVNEIFMTIPAEGRRQIAWWPNEMDWFNVMDVAKYNINFVMFVDNLQHIKQYFSNFSEDYKFSDYMENNSFITFLISHTSGLEDKLRETGNSYTGLKEDTRRIINFQKLVFDLISIMMLNNVNYPRMMEWLKDRVDNTDLDNFSANPNFISNFYTIEGGWAREFHTRADPTVMRANTLLFPRPPFIPHVHKVYYASKYFLSSEPTVKDAILRKLSLPDKASCLLSIHEIAVLVQAIYVEKKAAIDSITENKLDLNGEISEKVFMFKNINIYSKYQIELSEFFKSTTALDRTRIMHEDFPITNFEFDQYLITDSSILDRNYQDLVCKNLKELYNEDFTLKIINTLYIVQLLGITEQVEKIINTVNYNNHIFKKNYINSVSYHIPFIFKWKELEYNMRYLDKLKLNTVIDEPAKNRALGEVAKDIKKSYTQGGRTGPGTQVLLRTGQAAPQPTPQEIINTTIDGLGSYIQQVNFPNQCEKQNFPVKRDPSDRTFGCYRKIKSDRTDNITAANTICLNHKLLGRCGNQADATKVGCNYWEVNNKKYCLPKTSTYTFTSRGDIDKFNWKKKYLKYKKKYLELKEKLKQDNKSNEY